MADHFRHAKLHSSDVTHPFGYLDGLDYDDFCEAAYEVFFTACRSSPGFGGRSPITHFNDENGDGLVSPKSPGVGMAVTSRVKKALGLKMMQRSLSSKRMSSFGTNGTPSSPSGHVSSPRMMLGKGKVRRPMTSAEIMRQQMKVTEESDNRLRKILKYE